MADESSAAAIRQVLHEAGERGAWLADSCLAVREAFRDALDPTDFWQAYSQRSRHSTATD